MPKKKSPFVGYTEEEILASEAVSFVVIAGYNVFNNGKQFVFDKATAIRYYNKILKEATRQLIEGNRSEKKNARNILRNLRVEPLRIH